MLLEMSPHQEKVQKENSLPPLDITVSGCGVEPGQASAKDGADTESGKETRNRLFGTA